MPQPFKVNSPVCWANGSGQDTYRHGTEIVETQRLSCAALCEFPWQTPIGVMMADKYDAGELQIQIAGEFRVPLEDIYPSATADIENLASLIGRRVYYSQQDGKYIVQEAFIHTGEYPFAFFPGAATIGYISVIDEAAEEIGIIIDPRPPTTTYELYRASTSATWAMGTPVVADPETRLLTACTATSTQCTGVIAGWMIYRPGAELEVDDMVVATRGPAWYPLDQTDLYSINTRASLISASARSSGVPIDITGAVCTLGNTTGRIIIGTITLAEWYPVSPVTPFLPKYALLNVGIQNGGTT